MAPQGRAQPCHPQDLIELRACEAGSGHLGDPTWWTCHPQAQDRPLASAFKVKSQSALVIKSLAGSHTASSLWVIMVNPLWVLTRRRPAALGCQAARTGNPSASHAWVLGGGTVASSPAPATGRDPCTVFGDSTFTHFPVV